MVVVEAFKKHPVSILFVVFFVLAIMWPGALSTIIAAILLGWLALWLVGLLLGDYSGIRRFFGPR